MIYPISPVGVIRCCIEILNFPVSAFAQNFPTQYSSRIESTKILNKSGFYSLSLLKLFFGGLRQLGHCQIA